MPKNSTGREIEDSQQQFNTHSTDIQQTQNVKGAEKTQTLDGETDLEAENFIQHTAKDVGESGY